MPHLVKGALEKSDVAIFTRTTRFESKATKNSFDSDTRGFGRLRLTKEES